MGSLQEETTAGKREETGIGQREKLSCNAVATGDSRRDIGIWDGHLELFPVRQGVLEAGGAVCPLGGRTACVRKLHSRKGKL